MKFRLSITAVLLGALGWAQQSSPLLNSQQVNDLIARSLQLMEASAVTAPELNRAGAPLIENARQAAANLKMRGGNSGFTYSFLTNLRAYTMLSEAVPRPYPPAAEGPRQDAELRENLARLDSHFRALLEQKESQIRSPDRDNLRRYHEANAGLAAPAPARRRVVFMGDSITDGWRLNEYFPDQDFVNRGISGQITSEMLGRFKADVIDLKPEAVVILAGTNDLARGVSVGAIEDYYTMMADLADKHQIKIVWTSVLPVSDYHKDANPAWEMTKIRPPAYIRALNDWLKRFSAQRGYVYVDYFASMADTAGMLQADLANDGLHPNSAGYRIMAPLALDGIQRVLASNIQATKPPKRRLFGRS